jgi:Cof subfamily protein (haloacid dehalogenase superfamily)
MPVSALFLDIDRTLTSSGFRIPRRNIDALARAREMGHKVFLNTGRSHGNIPPDIFEQIEVDGIISGNGSVVSVAGEIIYSDFMPRDIFEKIAAAVYADPECWGVFEGLKSSYSVSGRGRLLSRNENDCPTLESLLEKCRDDSMQVVAVSGNFNPQMLRSLRGEMSVYAFDSYYDIVSPGNNKSKGMFRVLDALGISEKSTMAFGDSENDIEMLKAAAIGVAVANSQQKVLEIADYIAASNDDGGVGEAIERFILKGVHQYE